jgi:hypothetical protein
VCAVVRQLAPLAAYINGHSHCHLESLQTEQERIWSGGGILVNLNADIGSILYSQVELLGMQREGGTKSESKSPKATLNTQKRPPQTTKYITADASLVHRGGYRAKVYVKICRGGGCIMPERFMLLVNYIVQVAIKECRSMCAKLAAITNLLH